MPLSKKCSAKIEAMAEEYNKTQAGRTFSYGEEYPDFYKEGATPWAEWCERLVASLEKCEDTYVTTNGNEYELLVKEYRTWLEGGGDE